MNNIILYTNKIKSYSKSFKRTLQFIVRHYYYKGASFPSRKEISLFAGCSITYISDITRVLEDDGLLIKQHRFNNSVIYHLSPLFNDPIFKVLLKSIIPALAGISLHSGMLMAANYNGKSLHYINKEYKKVMKRDIIYQISKEMELSLDERLSMEPYDGHVLEYAYGILRKKCTDDTGWTKRVPRESRFRYFIGICRGQSLRKSRQYDPVEPIEKNGDVYTLPPEAPIKRTMGKANFEYANDPILAPPPVFKHNKPSIADIIKSVSDNLGLASITSTESCRTTNYVLSDAGVLTVQEKAKRVVKNKVEWENSVTAHVIDGKEQGLAAFAQLMMNTCKTDTEPTQIDNSIHLQAIESISDLVEHAIQKPSQSSSEPMWYMAEPIDMEEYDFI